VNNAGRGISRLLYSMYYWKLKLTTTSVPDAFDPTTSELTKPAPRAINKIGHALHTLSPQFRAASLSTTNAAIGRSLGFQDPRILQSMIICKQPQIGGRVPPHQDSTFLYTDPPSAVGYVTCQLAEEVEEAVNADADDLCRFWYALEDATVENGCLSFLKGSHKTAPIRNRFVRNGKGGTGFIDNESAQFPASTKSSTETSHASGTNGHANGSEERKREDAQSNEEEYTLGPVKAGSLVLIHGNLLHKSERNASQKSRFIYTYHMIEGGEETGHVYDEKNWLQPTQEGFSRLYAEAK